MQQPNIPYGHAQQANMAHNENVMYIFTPRPWGKQGRRSLFYNFNNGNFLSKAQEVIHKAGNNVGSLRGNMNALFNSQDALLAAFPSATASNVYNFDHFSDMYTFVLVVNENAHNLTVQSPMGKKRKIYYGYFNEEPVNMVQHGATPTPNPFATLTITHKTCVSESVTYGPYGQQRQIETTLDQDIVPTNAVNLVSSEDQYYMGPDMLHRNVGPMSTDGIVMSTVGSENKISNMPNSTMANDAKLQLPVHNIKHILESAAQTQETLSSQERLGDVPGNDLFNNAATFHETLNSNLSAGQTYSVALGGEGLHENATYTFQNIRDKYDPEILPFKIPNAQFQNTMDQTAASPNTMFNSYLTTCVPVYLSKGALATLSFSYSSFKDAFVVYSVESMTNMSDHELSKRTNAVLTQIKNDVLRPITMYRDDFEMVGTFSCGGVSYSQIHFHCDNNPITDEYFEMPNVFGGINSMLMGNSATVENNGIELAQLVNVNDAPDANELLGYHDARSSHTPFADMANMNTSPHPTTSSVYGNDVYDFNRDVDTRSHGQSVYGDGSSNDPTTILDPSLWRS